MSEEVVNSQVQSLLNTKAKIKADIANAEEFNKAVEDTIKNLKKSTDELKEKRDKLKKDIKELIDFYCAHMK
ncbi:hypothetical protein SteCoe_36106 [Stentor coeruleus]|uniref:Uncharacterized protein n=1 Tax=Stentor coeruleus TaxID=5963 RepID=A0A1R2AQX5_9CILI|nr:hypothetical protein SteCoe_36106 [Stentor coeruleus]